MNARSLRLRLTYWAIAAVLCAFALAGVGMEFIVGRTVERVALFDVEDQMRILTGVLDIGPDNQLVLSEEPRDPRFSLPYGGFYWQAGRNGKVELRSQSLWDQQMAFTPSQPNGTKTRFAGPNGKMLIGEQQSIILNTPSGEQTVTILVALEDTQIEEARREFVYAMAPSLAVLALALLGAVWMFLRFGLAPLDRLRGSLAAVHDRQARLIEGDYPSEIQPLVDDLNALILKRETQLTSARARAGDLAHGLKTPLAVLETVARELDRKGEGDIADAIRAEVTRMDAHVRRTLAQARAGLAAARSTGDIDIAPLTRQLVSTMQRISARTNLDFRLSAPDRLLTAMEEADYMEICGNILDNARKWAAREVSVTLLESGGRVRLAVADDGPGMPDDDQLQHVARGRRLDEAVTGSGFGLAIVKDLVEAYDGTLSFGRSPLGGLEVTVDLPGRT
ncbi:sensor histidine kinase [Gellertiella hungarica]|uniref:histidine kinase n=1 Tax=Gellertiella hungarica TaxID=1572859 RepID=A0A7W6JA29_9HYPH|nr:sensor histidine kinase [Gellertiella hungarica]MBB4066662.1 signal transduction histidine kinase [Gellertiella hungarica]